MASAGRILIMPKGAYSASTTYEMLDMVSHNGTTWLAKKTVAGIEPSAANSEHWQNMFNMAASDYLPISGGTLTGALFLGGGNGGIYSADIGTVISAKKDADNYRDIRVGSPSSATQPNDFFKMIDCKNGVVTDYKIFGEHNIPLLKSYVEQMIADYLAKN